MPSVGLILAQCMGWGSKAYGRYQTVEELRDVKGIGKKRMEEMRLLGTVKA